jgi:hypothetical protein
MYELEVKCEIELRIFSQSEKSQGHTKVPPRNSFHIEKPDTDIQVMKKFMNVVGYTKHRVVGLEWLKCRRRRRHRRRGPTVWG